MTNKNIKLTEEEKMYIKILGDIWKWIARDRSGFLCVHQEKPEKAGVIWKCSHGGLETVSLFNEEKIKFDFIKWEDEEPTSLDELRELVKKGE